MKQIKLMNEPRAMAVPVKAKEMSPLRALMQEINLDRAQGRTATAIAHDKWLPLIKEALENPPERAEIELIEREIDNAVTASEHERFKLLMKIRDTLKNRLT